MSSDQYNDSDNLNNFHFNQIDYLVFGSMIVFSAATGIYFGYCKKHNINDHQKTTASTHNDDEDNNSIKKTKKHQTDFGSLSLNEYLLGSRQLKVFPVAMSLVASYISGVTILGTPSEIYNFGTQYWFIIVPIFLMGPAVSLIYLPVFTKLRVGSSYEYLEMRFSPGIRSFASIMFVADEILFLPIIVYVPALAFNQVTGANIYYIGAVVCVVCVFYTLIGGIKAVVHTDAWQVMVMFISVVVVVVLGTISLGGVKEVFDRATTGGRIEFFNMTTSLYERHTFWSVLIGGFLYWTSFNSVNQTMVQRYMSLPNKKKAQQSIAFFTIGISLFVSVCCYAGVLIYAAYSKCDPMTTKLITRDDQLFPVYVMQTVGHLSGIPGLFVAGVFGAALSSLSVVLNSTSAVILEDIVKGCFQIQLTEKASTILVKGCIVILGIISLTLMFVVAQLGAILSLATSLSAIAAGTTFGVFTLGMLIPWSNTKGAISGAICGAFISGWIAFGSQIIQAYEYIIPHKLPISIENCSNATLNINNILNMNYPDESDVFPLYRLSFHWINPIGVFTVITIGTIVSFLTGPRNLKTIDPDLISPVIHRFLPKECFTEVPDDITILQLNGVETRTHLLVDGMTSRGAGATEIVVSSNISPTK